MLDLLVWIAYRSCYSVNLPFHFLILGLQVGHFGDNFIIVQQYLHQLHMFFFPLVILHLLTQLKFLAHCVLNGCWDTFPAVGTVLAALLADPSDDLHRVLELEYLHQPLNNLLFSGHSNAVQVSQELWKLLLQFFIINDLFDDEGETHLQSLENVISTVFVDS